jgi:predicted RNA-binding protein with PUA-like domain
VTHYWLIKSEPEKWSFQMQKTHHRTHWDGVRNYQASSYLKAMALGDLAFFYHSVQGKAIVGIVEVVRSYYPDFTDPQGRFGMVDVAYKAPLPRPVSLEAIKENPKLKDLPLIRQSRLSVMPIPLDTWQEICRMGAYNAL